MSLREERLVENQKAFRGANERLEGAVADDVSGDRRVPFICECTNDHCLERVELTLEEYSAVRAHENRYIIAPGHPRLEDEEVVEEYPGYEVTQK
jgi:hypothetical protein